MSLLHASFNVTGIFKNDVTIYTRHDGWCFHGNQTTMTSTCEEVSECNMEWSTVPEPKRM